MYSGSSPHRKLSREDARLAAMVLCPSCKNVSLKPLQYKSLTLDVCPQCKGLWIAKRELLKLAKLNMASEVKAAFTSLSSPEVHALDPSHKRDLQHYCPNDRSALEQYEWNVGSDVEMENCPRCLGFWMNADNLVRYVEIVQTSRSAKPGEIPSEVLAQLRVQEKYVDGRLEDNVEEATKRVVRWDFLALDDIMRTVIGALSNWIIR